MASCVFPIQGTWCVFATSMLAGRVAPRGRLGHEKVIDCPLEGLGCALAPGVRSERFYIAPVRDVAEFNQDGGNIGGSEHPEPSRLQWILVQPSHVAHFAGSGASKLH